METKHSKGDWQARRDECHYDSLTDIYAGDVKIAEVVASPNGSIVEELEANAILMASAPEMLECIENCFATLASIGATMEADIMKDIEKVIRRAIGK